MYASSVEHHMQMLYDSLSEKDRRRYAAVEAEKLGHGGAKYIADLFECDEATIRRGREDVEQLPDDEAEGRVRKKGGRTKLASPNRRSWKQSSKTLLLTLAESRS